MLVAETPNSILARSASFEVAMSANVLPVDAAAAEHWGHLTAQVKKTGRKAGLNDLWIAATAAANDLVVFTQDEGFAALRDLGGPAVVIA